MGKRRHFRHDLKITLPAICRKFGKLSLRQHPSAAVFSVNRVLAPRETVLDVQRFARIFIHDGRIFDPAFVDFRMRAVFHRSAEFQHDEVILALCRQINDLPEFRESLRRRRRKIQFQPAFRCDRRFIEFEFTQPVFRNPVKQSLKAVEQACFAAGENPYPLIVRGEQIPFRRCGLRLRKTVADTGMKRFFRFLCKGQGSLTAEFFRKGRKQRRDTA